MFEAKKNQIEEGLGQKKIFRGMGCYKNKVKLLLHRVFAKMHLYKAYCFECVDPSQCNFTNGLNPTDQQNCSNF